MIFTLELIIVQGGGSLQYKSSTFGWKFFLFPLGAVLQLQIVVFFWKKYSWCNYRPSQIDEAGFSHLIIWRFFCRTLFLNVVAFGCGCWGCCVNGDHTDSGKIRWNIEGCQDKNGLDIMDFLNIQMPPDKVFSDYFLGSEYPHSRVRWSPGSLVTITFLKTNKALENWPCEDVYPTEIGDFSLSSATNSQPKRLKINSWKMKLPFWGPAFWQVMTG